MTVFAYPEDHTPRRLCPRGEFHVVDAEPIGWPNVILGPPWERGIEEVARFLAALDDMIVPLCEWAVLAAALADPSWKERALATTHRAVQAALLGDLSPRWWRPDAPPGTSPPWWFKAPASEMSRGVVRVEHVEDLAEAAARCRRGAQPNLEWLGRVAPDVGAGIVQEHVPGPQHEITGVVGDPGQELWFEPLLQTWRGPVIEHYDPVPGLRDEMEALGSEVVRRLGLSWCFVCIEARRTLSGWKVIEAHSRPGDDPAQKGYPGATHLLRGIETLSRWSVEKKSRDRLTSSESAAMPS